MSKPPEAISPLLRGFNGIQPTSDMSRSPLGWLKENDNHCGDARTLLKRIPPESVALSFWSPPYFVGKSYEKDHTYESWKDLLEEVTRLHYSVIKPGGFLAINIADILAFSDPTMPRIQADNTARKKVKVTREQVVAAQSQYPSYNRYQLAGLLKCSEQTIDRRLKDNNVRGGKYQVQTKVKLAGGLIEEWATDSGFYLYDRRIWVKDPAWENSRWHSLSYRSVDEFEYVYIFWKPGITSIDRDRLDRDEWTHWGSRGVWRIPSVRVNDRHESEFPLELPRRVIQLFTGRDELVLDCFVGSGTTSLAAVQQGRRFIGIDIVQENVDLANRRCSAIQRELR